MKLYGPSLIFHLTNVSLSCMDPYLSITLYYLYFTISTSIYLCDTESVVFFQSLSFPSWVQLVEGFGDSMVRQKFWSNGWIDAARLPIWYYRDSRQATDFVTSGQHLSCALPVGITVCGKLFAFQNLRVLFFTNKISTGDFVSCESKEFVLRFLVGILYRNSYQDAHRNSCRDSYWEFLSRLSTFAMNCFNFPTDRVY